jgi:hypothetical protein
MISPDKSVDIFCIITEAIELITALTISQSVESLLERVPGLFLN